MAARWLVAPVTIAVALAWNAVARAQVAGAPPAASATASVDPPELARRAPADPILLRPPPLHVDYAQYGVAIGAMVNVSAGASCPTHPAPAPPCILGGGGGLVIRGGYRSPGPWYIGGAYEFSKIDSSNLLRLGIFQQLRAEMRYLPNTGYRASPYVTWGLGGVLYGNEWGVETGGASVFAGGGFEFEVSRLAVLGLGFAYRPVLLAGWTDTASIKRPVGVTQFVAFEFRLEVRTELGRR